jgi:hypothetical protein
MKTKTNPTSARKRFTTKPDVSTTLEKPEQRFVNEGCPNPGTQSPKMKPSSMRRESRASS